MTNCVLTGVLGLFRSHFRTEIMVESQITGRTRTSFSPPQERAVVNRFLLSQVGSVFAAGIPELDSEARLWRVPILHPPPKFTGDEVG